MTDKVPAIVAGVAGATGVAVVAAAAFGLGLSVAWLIAVCSGVAGLATAAAAFAMMNRPATAKPRSQSGDNAELDISALLDQAKARLRPGRKTLSGLPTVFVLGPVGSAKTSTVMNCGLYPEIVAGHIGGVAEVVPTRVANLMFVAQTLIVDTSGAILDNAPAWLRLISALGPRWRRRPAGAHCSALVCIPCSEAMLWGEQAEQLAESIRKRLDELAETVRLRVPVFVLFTQADRISFFGEYFASLTEGEAVDQLIGATFSPLMYDQDALNRYNEGERKREVAFDSIYSALDARRLEHLMRMPTVIQRANAYEFPREFRKLRSAVLRVLSSLDRPARSSTSPVVCGFYFSGIRMEASEPASTRSPVHGTLFVRALFDRVLLPATVAQALAAENINLGGLGWFYIGVIATCAISIVLLGMSMISQ